MLRPVSLLSALVAAATLLGPAAPTAAAQAAPAAAAPSPLVVTIDNLAPSTIPTTGRVRVSGTVTNRDVETWTSIAVYAFISDVPMTTTAELEAATETPPDELVGRRVVTEGTYDEIERLDPGESASYTIRVPRSELEVTDAGVYWFGAHALGTSGSGADEFADGRARTFLPLVPRNQNSVDAALVVPIRRQILHEADGSIADLDVWTETLSPGGSLRSLVDLGVASGSRSVSWLVDPAVVDAVTRIAAFNPPRSLASTVPDEAEGGDPADSDESDTASPSASPTEDGEEPAEEPSPEVQAAAEAATSWLERLEEGLEGSQILALPYGDVDVAAAAAHDPGTYRRARARSIGDLQPFGLATTPAVSSPTGYLDLDGIRLVEPGATVLVTDRMFSTSAPAVAHTAGRTLGVISSGAASGGPGPNERRSPLAVRQRIVSEAAVRALTPGRKPLIVVFPSTWRPDPADGFFEGLDLDWLDLTSVGTAMQRTGTNVPAERLVYPESQARIELSASNFLAANRLVDAGATLQNLLTQNDEVADEVADEALSDTSYSSRLRPETARVSAEQSIAWIGEQLASVDINAPKAVILSSGSGRFAATVSNELDEPVTVRIQAVADPPLEVEVPAESIQLAANSKTTVLLNASSDGLGVRSVLLRLTDTDDVPIGSSDALPIRSNQVSNVIWLIIGTGVALLFGAILMRLFRRVRAARS